MVTILVGSGDVIAGEEIELTPEEVTALRFPPEDWFYYQLIDEEFEKPWASGEDGVLDKEASGYTESDLSAATEFMFNFVKERQVKTFEMLGERYEVVVEDGDMLRDERRVAVSSQLLSDRTRELLLLQREMHEQQSAMAVRLNEEQADAANLLVCTQEFAASNLQLMEVVRALQRQITELQARAGRPTQDGNSACVSPASVVGTSINVGPDGWSRQPAKSGAATLQEVRLDEDQKRKLVKATQDLFSNILHMRPSPKVDKLGWERNRKRHNFWKKMMRVNTSQWLLLTEGLFFWNFMESEAASDEFALYALYEVLVLNINPDAQNVWHNVKGEMHHSDMYRLDTAHTQPFLLTSDLTAVPETVRRQIESKALLPSGKSSTVQSGTPATEPLPSGSADNSPAVSGSSRASTSSAGRRQAYGHRKLPAP